MATLCIPGRLETGAGSLGKLAGLVAAEGASKVLIIMDSILAKDPLNVHQKVGNILKEGNIEFDLFSDCTGEPTTLDVNNAVQKAQEVNAECIVAVGGGSALDIAKAVSLFAINPDVKWGEIVQKEHLKCVPIIAIPTTAGTGSEATKIMVITNAETNSKMNPGHPALTPKVAILDPELSVSLPKNFTAFTGMDALTHAIEGYVSTRATELSDFFAIESIKLCGQALEAVYDNGADLDARQKMLLASYYAGVAFSNASTNLAHAAGRALGAKFHIPHGLSVTVLLPFVMTLGLDAAQERYANVARALGADSSLGESDLAKEAVRMVEEYNNKFMIWDGAKKFIKDTKEFRNSIPALVEDAMIGVKLNPKGNNGIITNRRIPTADDIKFMFEKLADMIDGVK